MNWLDGSPSLRVLPAPIHQAWEKVWLPSLKGAIHLVCASLQVGIIDHLTTVGPHSTYTCVKKGFLKEFQKILR